MTPQDDEDDARGAIVITDPDMIQLAALQALKGALRLETLGINVVRGGKASTIVRKRFGWKGRAPALLEQLTKYIREQEKTHGLDRED